ncbi:hypothetical protein N665_0869s0004 [Sinapis alba]|nr:hypothetical protein N665_0869s0004 [Sinapis alba]
MRVFVDTKFGATFTFDLSYRNKLSDIKKGIEESEGIPVSTQKLFFNGVELAVDHYQLRSYRIVSNSRLLLELRGGHVNHQVLHQSPGHVLVSNEGQEVLHQNEFLDRVPETLTFGDNIKIQDQSLAGRSNKNQDLVQREPSLHSNTFGGDDPLFSTEAFTDILSQWPVSTTEAIANENQVFQTEHSIVQSNSTEESSSQVMFQTEKSPQPQKLMLTMTQYDKPGRKFLLEVNAADNVEELKKELEYQFNLPAEGYFLLHNERVLDDDKSFIINRVANGDTIEIFPGPVIEDCHT